MDADRLSIEKLQQGNEDGLKELMSRHRESLFRFIYRFVRNEADAAELTEETFYRVYQFSNRYRPKAKVVTWVFSIAGNLCRDFLRKNRKRTADLSLSARPEGKESGEMGESMASDEEHPDEIVVSMESLERVELAIHQLPHKLKFPFIYCVLENHSHDDCAEILGTSRKTVETRIYRARKSLQEKLAEYFGNV